VPFDFGPVNEDAFLAASKKMVLRYEASQHDGLGWVVHQLLDFKWGYLDGDLVSWSYEDIEAVLFELYPAKATIQSKDYRDVIRGFAGFLRFLGAEGFADGPATEELARSVESEAADFEVAMADEDLYSPGKRLVAEMVGEGVDFEDQAAVDSWITQFNQRSFDERVRVVGPPPVEDPPYASRPPADLAALLRPFPPVVLAPEHELVEAARASILFERTRRLVSFVGGGRKLTDKGNLTLADGKELVQILGTAERVDPEIGERKYRTPSSTHLHGVDLTFRVALAAGFLDAPNTRKVLIGRHAALLDSEPLEAIGYLFGALVQDVGPTAHRWGSDRYGWGWYADDLDAYLLAVMVQLYREQAPLGIDEIADEFWEMELEEYDFDDVEPDKLDFHKGLVNHAFRRAFDRLRELGLLVQADVKVSERPWGTEDEEGGTVTLTPLGVWLVHRVVSRVVDAPVAGTLAEVEAGELLVVVADLPENLAQLELDSWVERNRDSAAARLVDALPSANETGRSLAFRALQRIGAPAEQEVSRIADDTELGPYVTVWRIEAQVIGPEEMNARGDPDRFVRLLYAVLTMQGPEAVSTWLAPVAGADGVEAALNAAWRVRRPETETVLALLGDSHPDKALAKSARKALFRFRSSGPPGAS
jgi:hypothetical protein